MNTVYARRTRSGSAAVSDFAVFVAADCKISFNRMRSFLGHFFVWLDADVRRVDEFISAVDIAPMTEIDEADEFDGDRLLSKKE